MEGRQRRSFTDDYKRQAVDLVASSGRSIGFFSELLEPFLLGYIAQVRGARAAGIAGSIRFPGPRRDKPRTNASKRSGKPAPGSHIEVARAYAMQVLPTTAFRAIISMRVADPLPATQSELLLAGRRPTRDADPIPW